MPSRVALVLVAAALGAGSPAAGEFNKVLAVGDPAPRWEGLVGTDGKTHSAAEVAGKPAVVVFTCNSCPVATGYEDRLLAFAAKYAGRVAVVAINVNTVPEDRLPEMTKRAKQKRFPFPYLYDPSQEIARRFGAVYTPEFFVLDAAGKVAYLGAMDDKSPPGEPTVHPLEDAVEAVLAGKPAPVGETRARGCKVRYNAKKTDD